MTPLTMLLIMVILMIQVSASFVAFSLCRRGDAWIRLPILSIATVALAMIGYRWNSWLGLLVLPSTAHLFFWASLVLTSQALFPVTSWSHRKQAIKALLSYLLDCHLASHAIDGGKVQRRIPGHFSSRLGTGVILVGVGNAAILQTATRFSRILGPGVSFINRFELIKQAVDLHTQVRHTRVKARTKDAVPVEAPVYCLFRISTQGDSESPGGDFTLSGTNIRRVVYNQEGLSEEDAQYHWDDYVIQVVTARFQEILSRFRLDQLFAPDDPDQVPRVVLISALNAAVRNDLGRRDIELIFVGFGTLEFPVTVQQQRLSSWQAHWAAQVESQWATGEAEAEKLVQEAHGAAQWELVQGLISGLAAAQGLTGIEPADLITWQLLTAIESMSTDPLLHPPMPQETVTALFSIREWLETPATP